MANQEQFAQLIQQSYNFSGASLLIGGGMLETQAVTNTPVRIPLKTLNRHGLIAGATEREKRKPSKHFLKNYPKMAFRF